MAAFGAVADSRRSCMRESSTIIGSWADYEIQEKNTFMHILIPKSKGSCQRVRSAPPSLCSTTQTVPPPKSTSPESTSPQSTCFGADSVMTVTLLDFATPSSGVEHGNSFEAKEEDATVLHADRPELLSIGSTLHPQRCRPCSYFYREGGGCTKGEQCTFCHMPHERKQGTRPCARKRKAYSKLIAKATAEVNCASASFGPRAPGGATPRAQVDEMMYQ